VKALVVRRPWPELIACGVKDVENRGRNTSYRGPLLIVAGKGWDPDAAPFAARLGAAISSNPDDHPTGAVAVVDLTGVCSSASNGSACDCSQWGWLCQHHWCLANSRRFAEPVPVRGMPGLWTPTADVIAAVSEQLGLHCVEVPR